MDASPPPPSRPTPRPCESSPSYGGGSNVVALRAVAAVVPPLPLDPAPSPLSTTSGPSTPRPPSGTPGLNGVDDDHCTPRVSSAGRGSDGSQVSRGVQVITMRLPLFFLLEICCNPLPSPFHRPRPPRPPPPRPAASPHAATMTGACWLKSAACRPRPPAASRSRPSPRLCPPSFSGRAQPRGVRWPPPLPGTRPAYLGAAHGARPRQGQRRQWQRQARPARRPHPTTPASPPPPPSGGGPAWGRPPSTPPTPAWTRTCGRLSASSTVAGTAARPPPPPPLPRPPWAAWPGWRRRRRAWTRPACVCLSRRRSTRPTPSAAGRRPARAVRPSGRPPPASCLPCPGYLAWSRRRRAVVAAGSGWARLVSLRPPRRPCVPPPGRCRPCQRQQVLLMLLLLLCLPAQAGGGGAWRGFGAGGVVGLPRRSCSTTPPPARRPPAGRPARPSLLQPPTPPPPPPRPPRPALLPPWKPPWTRRPRGGAA